MNDLEILAELSDLDDDRRALSVVLYDDFRGRLKALEEQGRARERTMRAGFEHEPHGSPEYHFGMVEYRRVMSEYADRQNDLEDEFIQNLRWLFVTQEHIARFEEWLRWNRRRDLLPRFGYTEGRIDLLEILDDLEITKGDLFDPELFDLFEQYREQYARAIDAGLVARREWHIRQARNAWKEGVNNTRIVGGVVYVGAPADPAMRNAEIIAEEKKRKKRHELYLRTRDINHRYRRLFGTLLADETFVAFNDEYRRRRFPWLERDPYQAAAKLAEAMLALPSVTPEQREAVEALRNRHASVCESLNAKVARAIDETTKASFAGYAADVEKATSEEDEAIARRKRYEQTIRRRLWNLLSDSQKAEIGQPERPD